MSLTASFRGEFYSLGMHCVNRRWDWCNIPSPQYHLHFLSTNWWLFLWWRPWGNRKWPDLEAKLRGKAEFSTVMSRKMEGTSWGQPEVHAQLLAIPIGFGKWAPQHRCTAPGHFHRPRQETYNQGVGAALQILHSGAKMLRAIPATHTTFGDSTVFPPHVLWAISALIMVIW